MTTSGRLHGVVTMVTGGGHGIGAPVARRCAAEGSDVVVAGRSGNELRFVADEILSTGRRALAVELDQRDERSVVSALDAAVAQFGRVDVLVANSGVAGPTAPLWEVALDDWSETVAVNPTGTFLTCREAARHMAGRRSGSIVVVGSMTGKRPLAGRTPYATTKAALVGLVRTSAADLGPYGVRVNLISPGPVSGQRLDDVLAALALGTPWTSPRR